MASAHPETFRPIKITSLELSRPSPDLHGLSRFREVLALVRLHGSALGVVRVPIHNGGCSAAAIRKAAVDHLLWPIVRHLVADALSHGISDPRPNLNVLPYVPHPPAPIAGPSVSVAVCTRDRTDDLRQCLNALVQLDPAPDEILVVDNAPRTGATEELVAAFPSVRYVREPRPGLDWARNRAVLEATGDVVAFTDDDVVVDHQWVGAIRRAFADQPDVAAVTGLVLPFEIETEAQELFERYGGFGRGFDRRWYRVGPGESAAASYGGTGRFGTGANMAFRRSVLFRIGLFDPALDVGTVTNGGGDLEMFYRVLGAGQVLMYEPDAIVWHRHRREYRALREQLANNGVGFYSYLVRSASCHPAERWKFARLAIWWFFYWNVRRFMVALYKPGAFPIDLVKAELSGSIRGLFRYRRSRETARRLAEGAPDIPVPSALNSGVPEATQRTGPSVRCIDIAAPVTALPGSAGHATVDVFVVREGRLLGSARVENRCGTLSPLQLQQAIADGVVLDVFQTERDAEPGALWMSARDAVRHAFGAAQHTPAPVDASIAVSIVLATCDRPDDLRRALTSLARLRTTRPVEVIVVDNRPASGQTAPVVAAFPGVRLVTEPRGGLSYARNAGVTASTGAIVVMTDDDVVVPPDWLENLIAPFADAEVMAVTGNVLPVDQSTRAQRLFEAYGGLGRGMKAYTADSQWFWSFRHAVPTWNLGGTANAAFRAAIFSHPRIGLLDEALGAGTPTGCSEDTDLFYRVLRAGFRIVYEPQAYVWHRHRDTMEALRRQVYAYAKGQVAYQLTTLFRDGDWRALGRLFNELPRLYWWRVRQRLARRTPYPLSLVAVEIAGTLAGPVALWKSRRRVRRLGRSAPYQPVVERTPAPHVPPGSPALPASGELAVN